MDVLQGKSCLGALLTMVIDHSKIMSVEEISISKFKATCLAVIEQVRKSGKPVRVTRFGKPVAEVVPPSVPQKAKRELGTQRDRMKILGDIVSPASDAEDWEVLR